MIKLFYKSYDYKTSLAALKGFKKDTKEDLLFVLSGVLDCWASGEGMDIRARINAIYSVCDTESAAYLFYHLIKGSGANLPLVEIEDAMFNAGVSPNALETDFCEPWPLVLVKLAQDIELDFQESLVKKKSAMQD